MAAGVLLTFDDLAARAGQTSGDWDRADLRKPIERAGTVALTALLDGFARSQAPDGSAWAPLKHRRPGGGSSKPLLHTGALRNSIQIRFVDKGFEAFSNRVRAAIHQYGGTITPTRSKFLAIPLTAEAAAAGSPRKFPGLLVAVSRGNRGVLIERTGQRGRPRAHYALVQSVKIPARPFMGFSTKTVDLMADLMADHAVAVLVKRF